MNFGEPALMDYLTALEKAQTPAAPGRPAAELLLYSHWETKTLEVFLKAHALDVDRSLSVRPNGFGSLLLDLERLAADPGAPSGMPLVVLIEEEALLPGAALRSDHRPTRESIEAALAQSDPVIDRLIGLLSVFADRGPVFVLPPSAPGYPLLASPAWIESPARRARARLRARLLELQASRPRSVCVLDPEQIWGDLRPGQIVDDRLLFTGGWPFSMEATDRLARAICDAALCGPEARKLLITDADQTLWQGLAGDDGTGKISWAQEAETYRFFIYQKTLNLLMSEGVLVALCSKNENTTIDAAFSREDLVLDARQLAGRAVSWAPKSEMIARILSETNLLPSSAVFVDDSEFELGEVRNAFPEIKCLRFPENNAALRGFLRELRSSFDTRVVTGDDKTRAQSVRQAAGFRRDSAAAHSPEEYLASLEMKAQVDPIDPDNSDRAFQLVNKTNQFNLSGRRFEAAEWKTFLRAGNRIAWQLRFRDKNADYGIVSVLLADSGGRITDWVLSCRVFGRTIEHFMINRAFEEIRGHGGRRLNLEYRDTGKNGAIRGFLDEHAPKADAEGARVFEGARPLATFVQ